MVWEQHTLVVVMTTRVTERGRVKCHQYWETDIGGLMTHGFFNVRTTAIETLPDYTISTIELTNLKVSFFSHNFFITKILINIIDFRLMKYVQYHIYSLRLGPIMEYRDQH